MGFKMGQMFVTCDVLTSFSLSDILVDGCVFLPPVMDLTAPILYHILECGFESTNLERRESEWLATHFRSIINYLPERGEIGKGERERGP